MRALLLLALLPAVAYAEDAANLKDADAPAPKKVSATEANGAEQAGDQIAL